MELDLTEAREYFLLACRAYVPSDPFLLILTTNSKAVKYLKAGDFLFPVVLPQIHDTEERNLIFHKLMKLQFPPLIYSLKKPVLHMKESSLFEKTVSSQQQALLYNEIGIFSPCALSSLTNFPSDS